MVTCVERGKPKDLPERESEPQGTLMDLWVWDGGKSECRIVTMWIGVEPSARILHTKVGRLPSGVSSRDRQIIHLDKGKLMTKGLSLRCALVLFVWRGGN